MTLAGNVSSVARLIRETCATILGRAPEERAEHYELDDAQMAALEELSLELDRRETLERDEEERKAFEEREEIERMLWRRHEEV